MGKEGRVYGLSKAVLLTIIISVRGRDVESLDHDDVRETRGAQSAARYHVAFEILNATSPQAKPDLVSVSFIRAIRGYYLGMMY